MTEVRKEMAAYIQIITESWGGQYIKQDEPSLPIEGMVRQYLRTFLEDDTTTDEEKNKALEESFKMILSGRAFQIMKGRGVYETTRTVEYIMSTMAKAGMLSKEEVNEYRTELCKEYKKGIEDIIWKAGELEYFMPKDAGIKIVELMSGWLISSGLEKAFAPFPPHPQKLKQECAEYIYSILPKVTRKVTKSWEKERANGEEIVFAIKRVVDICDVCEEYLQKNNRRPSS